MAEHDIFGSSSLEGNSYKSRKSISDFKMDKVTTGTVKQETLGEKIFHTFIVSEPKDVAKFLVKKKLVPKIKSMIVEMVSSGIDMLFTGNQSSSTEKGYFANSNVPYYSYSVSSSTKTTASTIVQQKTTPNDYQKIIFQTMEKAKDVKNALQQVIDVYQCVRVADYYNAVGHPTTSTDNNYGWRTLEGVTIDAVDGGFMLNMPKAIPLDYTK